MPTLTKKKAKTGKAQKSKGAQKKRSRGAVVALTPDAPKVERRMNWAREVLNMQINPGWLSYVPVAITDRTLCPNCGKTVSGGPLEHSNGARDNYLRDEDEVEWSCEPRTFQQTDFDVELRHSLTDYVKLGRIDSVPKITFSHARLSVVLCEEDGKIRIERHIYIRTRRGWHETPLLSFTEPLFSLPASRTAI